MDFVEAPKWTFESVITNPAGVSVSVMIDVPVASVWKDVRECAEIAQMAAIHAVGHISKSSERPPF
jgi:hypothetical protein